MSIKGKIRTIPPYYKTLGNGSFEFGEEHTNPRHKIVLHELLGGSLDLNRALQQIDEHSVTLSPYVPFIPVPYLRYARRGINMRAANEATLAPFLTPVVRRQINNHIVAHNLSEKYDWRKLQAFAPKLAAIKAPQWTHHPVAHYLHTFWAETETTGKPIIDDVVAGYLHYDVPLILSPRSANYRSVFSRDDIFRSFSGFFDTPRQFSQRTYRGFTDFGMLLYSPVQAATGTDTAPLQPAVMAVMTPENYIWQKLYWMQTGTFDLQRMSFLVDRELDFPTFPINGLRELYKQKIEPWLVGLGANIWKVPKVFIEDYALMQITTPQSKNILEQRRLHNEIIQQMTAQLGALFTGRPQDAVLERMIEDPAVAEARTLAATLIVDEEENEGDSYWEDAEDDVYDDDEYDGEEGLEAGEDAEEAAQQREREALIQETVASQLGFAPSRPSTLADQMARLRTTRDTSLDEVLREAPQVAERSEDDWLRMAESLAADIS